MALCDQGAEAYRKAVKDGPVELEHVPLCLTRLGLMTPLPRSPHLQQAVPPAAAAAGVLLPLERQLHRFQSATRSAKEAYSTVEALYAEARREEEPAFTLITGAEAISNALEAATAHCEQRLLTAQPGGGRAPEILAEVRERSLKLLKRGVQQLTIYQHSVRSHGPTMSYIECIIEAGAEVRTIPEVFDRLIICDQALAFIPVSDQRAVAALEIRQPAVIRHLTRAFERIWDQSQPIGAHPTRSVKPVVSDLQRSILKAIISGETDESTARRLGISRRSVAEHVRRISDQLGSSSRAQLGYMVASSGILQHTDLDDLGL